MKSGLIEKLLEKALESEDIPAGDHPFKVDYSYFFRTVTYHFIGTIQEIRGKWIILKDASWIADSGRFNVALEKGELSEVEYMGKVFLNMDTFTDVTPWAHKLPKESK